MSKDMTVNVYGKSAPPADAAPDMSMAVHATKHLLNLCMSFTSDREVQH